MEPLLSLRGLTVDFSFNGKNLRAVDDLSYDIFPGRTLAVVGESGCGKSVHALAVMGLLPASAKPSSGEIFFEGRDLLKLPEEERRRLRGRRVAMIFQEPMNSLNPVMRIGEQIGEAVILHKGATRLQARERAVALLGKVGIPKPEQRVDDYPHQFSGGMRQRAMIAMALSCEPSVLIADEPTTALDVTIQAQILELIKNLGKELNMAMVLITHNLGVVASCAEDAVVMYAGRAVEKGPVPELFKDPAHPYTQALLGSVPSLFSRRERLPAIEGQPPELSQLPRGCAFGPRCAKHIAECDTAVPLERPVSSMRSARCVLAGEGAETA